MFEREGNSAQISFQWAIGDTRPLEKNLIEICRSKHEYGIIVLSRLAAYGLTFAVAFALLPGANLGTIFIIALTGSLSIWVSWGFVVFSMRALDRQLAKDPHRVGWNSVRLDASGITWSTETSLEYTSWLGVTGVAERDGSLWLKTGPAHGYYLPPRIFASREELVECKNLIGQLREQPLQPKHLADAEEGEEGLVKH